MFSLRAKCVSVRLITCAAAVALLAGCAIRPLPKHVTGYSTFDIVQKIRCEFRDALRTELVYRLEKANYETIADKLKNKKMSFSYFTKEGVNDLSKQDQAGFDAYRWGRVGYDFEFEISEENNLGGGIDFAEALTEGTFTLGFTGANNRSRKNKRVFRIIDSFYHLLIEGEDDPDKSMCRMFDPSEPPNHMYPITGKLNLHETLSTFVKIRENALLVGATPDTINVPVLTDEITFTTELTGDVSPAVKLNPTGPGLELSAANLKFESTRKDVHKLTLAITLPAQDPAHRTRKATTRRTETKPSRGNLADKAVFKALDDQINRSNEEDDEEVRALVLDE